MNQPYSTRSPVFSLKGICSSSQPLVSKVGTTILEKGGNSADACIAMSACLSVIEPCSTGIGGDCFCLFYDSSSKKVTSINGSGKSPKNLSYDKFSKNYEKSRGPNSITVPGAVAGWQDISEKFGKLNFGELLKPAIEFAENGFPVSTITSYLWKKREKFLLSVPNGEELLKNQKAPKEGEIFKNEGLSKVLKDISKYGRKVFYEGWIAEEIVKVIQENGGELSLEDLKNHSTLITDSISINYKGIDIHEVGPNSQGICALIALNILENFDLSSMEYNSTKYLHTIIEALKCAFSDTKKYVGDPEMMDEQIIQKLLSKEYAKERSKIIDVEGNSQNIESGSPLYSSDTIQFCVIDQEGNACSFVNSNYCDFGTGISPKNCGFPLQNRGSNFVLEKGHSNCYQPEKRPYHTIIPAIATKNDEIFLAFGVMGGFAQPQAHVQVFLNMVEFGMNPQVAIDKPRILIDADHDQNDILIEDGINEVTINGLKEKKHKLRIIKGWSQSKFGRGQIILKDENNVLWGGSDRRSDGCAIPLI
eukprot:gene3566-6301_t